MDKTDAVINPVKGKKAPETGPLAVLVSSGGDLRLLRNALALDAPPVNLMMSRIYPPKAEAHQGFSIAGPVTGAPYAAMMMETLIAWGAEKILFLGWCGSICDNVRIGDIIVPDAACVDEGTSPGYGNPSGEIVKPPDGSKELIRRLKEGLVAENLVFQEKRIWTTDAIYRETPEKIKHFQDQNAVGVEMEISALYTVGAFRNVPTGAVLVVSDELASLTWKPGFKDKRFKESRRAVIEVIRKLCLKTD
jgi:purine-nucleoside phosphorylase